jgi:hypothetical protein
LSKGADDGSGGAAGLIPSPPNDAGGGSGGTGGSGGSWQRDAATSGGVGGQPGSTGGTSGTLSDGEAPDARVMFGGIELWDFAIVVRDAYGWTEADGWGTSPGVFFPTPDVLSRVTTVSRSCLWFEDMAQWSSERGLSPITLATVPDGDAYVATYDEVQRSYTSEGTSTSPAWGSTGTLTATAIDAQGVDVSASVEAPPLIKNPGWFVDPPAGLKTLFRAPDGSFDVVRVSAHTDGATGYTGVRCEYRHDEMLLEGSDRVTPLVDEAGRAALAARGVSRVLLVVGYFRSASVPGFLPGSDVALRAGRVMALDEPCVRDRSICP